MNKWQERFARKVDSLRQVAADRFQHLADETLVPVFSEFKEFTSQQGFDASDPMTKKGLRTYKFAVSENAYLLLTFRVAGIEHCESVAEFSVPHHNKLRPQIERLELGAFDPVVARNSFERALDGFMEVYLKALEKGKADIDELADAKRR